MLPTTPLQELFNLRWYIQQLMDESEYDDDDLKNPLHEDNSLLQTRRKFMKYVIYNGHTMTHKHVDKTPVRPITKTNPHHKHDTNEWESGITSGLSEDSISGTPTGSSEDSVPIETPKVSTIFNRSRHNDADSSIAQPISEFEPPQENGEQIAVRDNKVVTTNIAVEIQNGKDEGLIAYSFY